MVTPDLRKRAILLAASFSIKTVPEKHVAVIQEMIDNQLNFTLFVIKKH